MARQFKVMRVERKFQVPLAFTTMEVEAEELATVNAELVEVEAATEDKIIELARDADALLVIFAPMTRRVLQALPRLKVIVRYGIGYDNVDVDAATDNGVLLVNIPDFCLEEVANHAIALLLILGGGLLAINEGMKQNRWAESQLIRASVGAPYEQTLGLVGCGKIGRMTARKAQCFGLRILGYDPYVDKSLAKEYGITLVSLPELLKESDFVSVHTLLNQETRHLIGEKEFKQMKPTAYFINTARGAVVDEAALIKALQEKRIAGAGLDVFEQEPVEPDNPLLKMDNVIVSPHCCSHTVASIKRLKQSVGQEAARVLSGRWPKNVVNQTVKPKINLVKEE
ncbi:MAG: C-terminal binding protein [Dehalococcoidales bacterium]